MWYTIMDFISEIEKYLWKPINYIIANNKKPKLNKEEKIKFQNDISVKWWEYIFITSQERKILKQKEIKIIEADLIDKKTLYKHEKVKLTALLEKVIIDTEKNILLGRDEDRTKISMSGVPLKNTNN